jgi:hypothetical protein
MWLIVPLLKKGKKLSILFGFFSINVANLANGLKCTIQNKALSLNIQILKIWKQSIMN